MYTEEGYNETHEKGNGIGAVGGVKSLEEDERGDDGCRRKTDVVHRIYDVGREGIQGFVEVVHLDNDT